jgi:hypothetical protein
MTTDAAQDGRAYRYVSEYTRSGKLRRRRIPVTPTPRPAVPSAPAAPEPLRPVPSGDAHPAWPVLVDGRPIDPLAFDADPDAFLRAVFGPTYGEAR